MKSHVFFAAAAAIGLVSIAGPDRVVEVLHAQSRNPIVFQAAGPTLASIQGTVDAFRAALGDNNGSVAGPLPSGRREINWDGGGSTATSVVPTPFDGFLVSRGARFTTNGSGFVQAPVEGLAQTFNNPGYVNFFQAFSPSRLFSTIDSNVTTTRFFVPGGGEVAAVTNGFGAVFSDVDRDEGLDTRFVFDSSGRRTRRTATAMRFFDPRGRLLFSAAAPASPGNASVSFLGVVFPTAQVARVRITTGNAAPGPRLGSTLDVVMMDDFIYGEPQALGTGGSRVTEAEAVDAASTSGGI